MGKAHGALDKNVRFVKHYARNVPVVRVRVGAWHRKAAKLWAMLRLLPQACPLCAHAPVNASHLRTDAILAFIAIQLLKAIRRFTSRYARRSTPLI